ncbi:NADP-dependent 3-hydroxy acid dehydrogenase YdfG [Microbacterium sp. AK009]|uniref:SDR family NAD(P)-dependent oxidoreductase n=1 Tax=Microbacterium sp. AK009 TaxID=2723068 RepID=UPI0015CA747E|nr:SDR family NAD(P)-dependent oxidoreductase [Microbacterium sp. AK009]NYF15294.1 NADP-dependent 3-hydroxy acid dehydrogenase YdfG [Microbacterium sp. AK009]
MTDAVAGRVVLLAGGTSAVGRVAAEALTAAGAHVVVAGRDPEKLAALASAVSGIATETVDLTDEAAVIGLAARVRSAHGRVDGILHLVGGWRGGGGLAGQSDHDYRVLETSLTALRHVTRAFFDDLVASPVGRLAMISSTAVARPLAGGANYAAVKAASEAWTRAVAHGLAKAARDAGEPASSAAVVFRVKSLEGLEERVATEFVALFSAEASSVNDDVVTLDA